ncbi:MAG TPA: cytochrome c-type biogenesis protein CcmH [Sedimenticola thiotaurini]|uniref:Cytochrome c-type biogenesis protein n=1 Tax=Sedimenticola thiotaurini TaxID=1543721 RepID=A0A831RLG5_9GAMM|nr:cytochrome c-type biogenesis protein CcmH [Sedimenticola thiotaurini]
MRYGWLLPLLLLSVSAFARIEVHSFDSPEQEATYKELIDELRCLVCQNQNLADSNADLAKDLRRQTYEMIKGGAGKQDVIDYMVQRYGDFVLYRPPLKRSTLLLWAGPFIILGIGVLVLMQYIRRRRREAPPNLSREDHERASQLLNDKKS